MRTFSQTLLSLSTVANLRGLKSIAAALCFGITLCLTGIANAQTDTYSWTGTIVSVEVDDGTGFYTGTQVGDTFSGTFTYDPDVANIDHLHTSDGDSIIEPGDVWVEYFPGSASATLTDGTTQLIAPRVQLNITTDIPLGMDDPDDQEFVSNVFGKEVPLGTLVDVWGLDSENFFPNVDFGVVYISLVNMQDDLSFRPTPPWSPPGSPNDPDNQIAIFEVFEDTATGNDIFSAFGIITMAEVQHLPVEYTFSTTGQLPFTDPLLTGLTSVSGSFIYENAAAPGGAITAAVDPASVGSTFYIALSNLSGDADGNSFSDPLGFVAVGDDKYSAFSPPTDIVGFAWDPTGSNPGGFDFNFSGFTFAGMPLTNVTFGWIEGIEVISDFLDDQSLPSVLPPPATAAGTLGLHFVDPATGVPHIAFFGVDVVAGSPVDTPKVNFHGQLDMVRVDNGGAVYSGVPTGSNFSIEFDLVTGFSTISDGTIVTPFSAFFEDGSFFLVINDEILDADDAAEINSLAGTSFVAGDLIDIIELEGDALTAGGGIIEIGVRFILDSLAFDDESPDNYPPNPDDVLLALFDIEEDDEQGVEIYAAGGVIDSDGDGMPDDFELANGFDPNNPDDANEDADSDGLTNLEEFIGGTLPHNPDSDGDTVLDGLDALPNNPNESVDTDGNGIGNNADTDDDGDTMPDDFELANGLDPLDAADATTDADGDGFTNLREFRAGTDPQNAEDFPAKRKVPVAINTILLGEDETISYSFSTGTASGIGEPALVPLFAGFSVSGTFNYASSVPAVGVTTGPGVPGAAIYAGAPTSIAGSVNGLNFSDSSGFSVVGNDRFVNTGLTDFLSVAAGQLDTATFEINGFTLVDVRLFWIEGSTTIEDFLVSDGLPPALPEIEGRLALDFTPTADPGVETSVFFDGLFVSPMP